jgi:hypothetical protein
MHLESANTTFPSSIFDKLYMVGHRLPNAIMGVICGKLQVVPFGFNTKNGFRIIQTPKDHDVVKWEAALKAVRTERYPLAPGDRSRGRLRHLDKKNRWQRYNAWCFRHKWVGNTGLVRLPHAYCRVVRQNCPTGHLRWKKGLPTQYGE